MSEEQQVPPNQRQPIKLNFGAFFQNTGKKLISTVGYLKDLGSVLFVLGCTSIGVLITIDVIFEKVTLTVWSNLVSMVSDVKNLVQELIVTVVGTRTTPLTITTLVIVIVAVALAFSIIALIRTKKK